MRASLRQQRYDYQFRFRPDRHPSHREKPLFEQRPTINIYNNANITNSTNVNNSKDSTRITEQEYLEALETIQQYETEQISNNNIPSLEQLQNMKNINNRKLQELESIKKEIENEQTKLEKENRNIDNEIAKLTPVDPQGFKDKEGNQYDFFIDKDNNGDLSNETEFLGYEGGLNGQEAAWAEMTELDTSGDGFVDAKELEAGGVKVYRTDVEGNQQAMNIIEAFGKNADLKISTTQHKEAKKGIGPNNFNIGTGSENNELWGTFNVSLNGENLIGYQTNDDLDWLKENYNFSDYSNFSKEDAIKNDIEFLEKAANEYDVEIFELTDKQIDEFYEGEYANIA